MSLIFLTPTGSYPISGIIQIGSGITSMLMVGMGQSNMEHWSSTLATYGNKAGENAYLAGMGLGYPFIQGATSGSFLSQACWIAAASDTPNHWWWNDTDPNPANWGPGPRFNDMLANLTANGKSLADIDFVVWSQGEADGAQIGAGTFTSAAYQATFLSMINYLYANCPKLKMFFIRPIGKLINDPSDKVGYMAVRQIQQTVEALMPTKILCGSEKYDCQMRFENDGAADTVHLSGNGHALEGTRLSKEVKKLLGTYLGGVKGPQITSAVASGNTIVCTVTHDGGNNLGVYTDYTNTNSQVYTYWTSGSLLANPEAGKQHIFKIFDAQNNSIPISSVAITGSNQITITLAGALAANGNKLYYGYGSFADNGRASMIFDNQAGNALPMKTILPITVNGSIANFMSGRSDVVVFMNPANTYVTPNAGSDTAQWTKQYGSGGNPRRDDAKAVPTWYANSNMGLSIPGFYFTGASGMKLLVDCSLTTASDYTLFVVATPGDVSADTGTNALITTGNTSNTAPGNLFMITQPVGTSGILNVGAGGQLFTSDIVHTGTTGLYGLRRSGSTLREYYETGIGNQPDKTIAGGTNPVIDSDGGPVFSIGNGTGHTSTDTTSCFIGAVHYVAVFSSALNDTEAGQIRLAMAQAAGIA